MYDKIEKLGHSIIQHGPNSNRVYLMHLDPNDFPGIIEALDDLSITKGYTKIFAKVPGKWVAAFLDQGYKKEAIIPNMINGNESVQFISRFFGSSRSFIQPDVRDDLENILTLSQASKIEEKKRHEGISIRRLAQEDAAALADLYHKVFQVYPFPIFEPGYIKETMRTHITYFGAFDGTKLVAASSAEMDRDNKSVEMTDFATLPDFLGKSISYFLLAEMESEMIRLEMKTFYTIARAASAGMNITFARRGYTYSGRLVNNTLIGESIESMNVWYKSAFPGKG